MFVGSRDSAGRRSVTTAAAGVFPADGPDSVLVCYRVLPLRLATPTYHQPRTLIDSLNFAPRSFSYNDFAMKEQILATPANAEPESENRQYAKCICQLGIARGGAA